jgi:hypothetical protein
LREYLRQPAPGPQSVVDVHGNQVALLALSGCFRASTMTCSTCHDVHAPQRDAEAFSATCLGCHEGTEHRTLAGGRGVATTACVDCHMPVLASNAVVARRDGRSVRARVRTHWISVYPGMAR